MLFNQIKTVMLLAALSGLLLLLGDLIGGHDGIIFALVMALVMNGLTYFFSDRLVLMLYRAQPLDRQTHASIYQIVESLAQKMQLPMPKLWLVQSPMANAFATGRSPQHASIAVTTSILSLLEEHEIRAVLAHELSHIKNRDMLVSTIAAVMASAIGYLAHSIRYAALWASMNGEKRRQGSSSAFSFLVAFFMPLAAALLQLAISRSREYLADERGADACQDPLALASALEKLHNGTGQRQQSATESPAHAATASLFFIHPFSGRGLIALFSTHPPVEERIARLKKIWLSQQQAHRC